MENKASFESRCVLCGKFLTRPMMSVENRSLSSEDFNKFRGGVDIRYGAETKCRKCKRIRETLENVSS